MGFIWKGVKLIFMNDNIEIIFPEEGNEHWNKIDKPLKLKLEGEMIHTLIKIDLSASELERINDGYVIQTQYPWLTVGRK